MQLYMPFGKLGMFPKFPIPYQSGRPSSMVVSPLAYRLTGKAQQYD